VPPVVHPAGDRGGPTRSHAFIPATAEGWQTVALTEWELIGEEWVDEHPFDEITYVLAGTLYVTCDDVTVEVTAGSVVRVPAGSTGTYSAPDRARMLAIYGPNPDGRPTRIGGLRKL
jgi:mannose-6-phosphate isomerase-like protein (cupin superfamily)